MIESEVSPFADTSNERNDVDAVVHDPIIYTAPPRISYVSPVTGLNDNGVSNHIVGVVVQVFPTIHLSSTFPAVFQITRILNPLSPLHPRFASIYPPVGNT